MLIYLQKIYDVTANSVLTGKVTYKCDPDVGNRTVESGPVMVTFSDVSIKSEHVYRAYQRTHADTFAGKVDAGHGYGTKWGYLEVIFK